MRTAILLAIVSGVIACSGLMSGGAVPASGAITNYTFDPQLSLTGACKTSEEDSVPDPGCPGGSHPPAGAFNLPRSITTDSYGDIYVASYGNESANGAQGRIDIFNPQGEFITEVADPAGPRNIAVDSKGNLYVFNFAVALWQKVELYEPTVYKPATGEIAYGKAPTLVTTGSVQFAGLAVDRTNDHLFVHLGPEVQEFGSAEEANKPLDVIGAGELNVPNAIGLAVDATRGRLYVGDSDHNSFPPKQFQIDVFELKSPHALIGVIDGSTTPAEKFTLEPSVAVDEATGNVFAYPGGSAVYELSEDGAYLASIEHSLKYVFGGEIGIDNGLTSLHRGYLWVPSRPTGEGHAFAFGPSKVCPPKVEHVMVDGVMEREVELHGEVNPCGLPTSYSFEYTPQSTFEAKGFTEALVAEENQLPAGAAPVEVSAALSDLSPGTRFRFRLFATNELDSAEEEGEFTTYPLAPATVPCPNDGLRRGFSAALPDCRAFELVTPPSTNARSPRGVGRLGPLFATRQASPSGSQVSFLTEGGALPGGDGTGSLGGDPYLSMRSAGGWITETAGPSGGESVSLLPGGISPDQGYSFWSTGGTEGSAAIEGQETMYVRYPDGHSALVGRGSLRSDAHPFPALISENGVHILFTSVDELEPAAPPAGTVVVYDRTSDEVTHVVSLLPGDKTPAAGENASYAGASLDGRGVAFEIGNTLYLRYENAKTFEIGKGVTFAGIAEGGNRIFYVKEGKLLRFDALTEEVKAFNEIGIAVPVNVSADGSAVYLVSTTVLTPEANPVGAKAKAGQQNLYLSEEGAISFVGTVTEEDVLGETTGIGLGRWAPHVVSYEEAAEDPSRTTQDGRVMLFESRANLTGYDSGGRIEVYRFDADAAELTCVSCNPTGAEASGDASLQSMATGLGDPQPLATFGFIPNLSANGRRAFFQSTDRLVPADTDGLQDVYEWEAAGIGSCTRAEGCLFLISSGQSSRINYLYGVSASGDDVFFRSSDLLVPADLEETPSIYDARVGGGFAEEAKAGCEAEGCRPDLGPPPSFLPSESAVHPSGRRSISCAKGKRKVRHHGKVRCVNKNKHHKHRRYKAGSNQKGAGK